MTRPYDPRSAIRRATRSMDSFVTKHTPAAEKPLHLSTQTGPIPCAVLLRSLTDGGPVPDDFQGLTTGEAIRSHVRPDGAMFLGAFELQSDRDSVVLMYGPATLDIEAAEQYATMERPSLIARHHSFTLGPFAAHPVAPTSTNDATS